MSSAIAPIKKPLSQKTIVVTGASSGAGRAIAMRFAAQHANLVLASRNADELQAAAQECEELGARVLIVPTDMSKSDEVKELAQKATELMGAIDVWVNNAGVLAAGAFTDTPMPVHEQVIKTNLLGYMNAAHAVLPYFKKQGYGIIINNISVGGFLPVAYGSSYTASKFGLRGFFEALQSELSPFNDIYICNVYPSFLDTPGIQHAANYTGVYIKPAPPVFDPLHLADVIVKLAQHPRNATNADFGTPLFKTAYSLAPAITRRIMEKVMRTYFKQAPSIEQTDGNVFSSANYGNAVYGGWNTQPNASSRKSKILQGALLAGILATGIILFTTKRNR